MTHSSDPKIRVTAYLACPPDVRNVSGCSKTVLTEATVGCENPENPWSPLNVPLKPLEDPNESENESVFENELPEELNELPGEPNELLEEAGALKTSSVKNGFGSGGGSAG
jgi:hypothetical protein